MITRHAGIIFLLLFFVMSCSGVTDSGITPDLAGEGNPSASLSSQADNTSAQLWGIWDISIDPVTESIGIVPLRGPAFTLNVVGYVDSAPGSLALSIQNIDIQPDYTDISINVGIKHPFPGLNKFMGFDVLGVFMTDGSETFPGTPDLDYGGPGDQQLLNPDGYTRWFNSLEFSSSTENILGYIPGTLGTSGYTPAAQLNPYKYYADSLADDEAAYDFLLANPAGRGVFTPSSVNTRRFDLRFPETTGIVFQYAVIAHWESAGVPNPDIDDFPTSANADEALLISIEDTSNAYYLNPTHFGGNVVLDITPWDWSAEPTSAGMEEYYIRCYSDAWTGEYLVDMNPVTIDAYNCTYHASIPAVTLDSNDPLQVWIDVVYPDLDYSNPFGSPNSAGGSLAGYFVIEVPISEIPIDIEPVAVGAYDTNSCDSFVFYDDGSYDPDGGDIALIEWDWDNDGVFDEEGNDLYHYWKNPGTYYVQMRVTDDEAQTGVLDTPLEIVIDQGDPSTPSVINTVPLGSTLADDVEVFNGYAYVINRYAGLRIVDVDPPESAYIVNTVDPGGADDVAYADGYAYIADWTVGLHIIDVDPPDFAHLVKTVDSPGYNRSVAYADGYAYLGNGNGDYTIIDVDPPEAASIVNSVPISGYPGYSAVVDGYAYLSNQDSDGTNIIDIDPPESASIVKTIPTDASWDLVYADGYAYVGVKGAAMDIIDVDPIDDAYTVISVPSDGYYPDCAISGEYAFMSGDNYPDPDGFIQVIDVSPPETAHTVSVLPTTGRAFGIDVSVCYAYMTTLEGDLIIIQLW